MNNLTKKHTAFIAVMALLVIAVFSVLHTSCDSDAYSICLVLMCSFMLTSAGISFLLANNTLMAAMPVNRGVSIHFRLERPPRI